MRETLLISAAVHAALLLVVAVPYQRETAHGETMQVELVRADEAPAFNEPPPEQAEPPRQPEKQPQAQPQPDFSKLRLSDTPAIPQEDQTKEKLALPPPPESKQQAAQQQVSQQQAQQQQQARQQPAAQPQQSQSAPPPDQPQARAEAQQDLPNVPPEMAVESLADQRERLAALMNLPSGANGLTSFGTEADTSAKLADTEIGKFRAHLRSCLQLPAGVKNSQQIKLIIRIALLPNGTLAAQPSLIEAAASEMGLPLYRSAIAAIKQCAPYTMFSADRYKEWRVLDINFSPDAFMRG